MKRKILFGFVSLVLAGGLLTSCSEVPQAEIDAANAAITEAQVAGADIYVPEVYAALKDSMSSVMEAIEVQKSKFIKNYSSSVESLKAVNVMATDLVQKTEVVITDLKAEITSEMEAVAQMNEANTNLLAEAPRGKEGTAALEAIKAEIDMIQASVEECNQLVLNASYLEAKAKIVAAKEKAVSINAELSDVIAKYKANVRGRR